jgi:hypothetical protein
MDERVIEVFLKIRYPDARFKVEIWPFGDFSRVLVVRTDLYNERGEEVEEEIKELLRKHGVEIKFYRDLSTGMITAGEFAFILVGPLKEEK